MTDAYREKLNIIEKDLLKSRAIQLAAPIKADESQSDHLSVLVMDALEQQFAIPLDMVDAISRIVDIFPIPGAPPHITGVIRRRGKTEALINLRLFFYPNTEGLIDEDYAVIVSAKKKTFGIQISDVEGVQELCKQSIMPVPDGYDRAIAPHLSGITTDGTGLLNLNNIVSTEGFGTTEIK